jgi:hypothetical protein
VAARANALGLLLAQLAVATWFAAHQSPLRRPAGSSLDELLRRAAAASSPSSAVLFLTATSEPREATRFYEASRALYPRRVVWSASEAPGSRRWSFAGPLDWHVPKEALSEPFDLVLLDGVAAETTGTLLWEDAIARLALVKPRS